MRFIAEVAEGSTQSVLSSDYAHTGCNLGSGGGFRPTILKSARPTLSEILRPI